MFELSRRIFMKTAMAAALPKYRIIDPHVHVWKHDPKYPFAVGQKAPDRDATPETLLGLMKQHNVEKTVIIQVIHYRYDNSYLADVLKQYPQYFQGVARVDPLDPGNADHLSRLTETQHFRGVRLSPAAGEAGDWINGPLMPPLWARCDQLKVPMTILAPITRMPDVGRLADRFPELTIVIDHMADCPVDHPDELQKLIDLKRHSKLFVKVSHTWSLSKQRYPWLDSQQLVKRLYDSFGPQRLMWATDWPIVENVASYDQAFTVVHDDMKFLSAEDKSWMMSKTIERVWPFP
ncbi:MAG: amidohydrolase [Acidobacteriaceae bacterium]|nr:amidohydrolase [Acidobacteriaceae bacterium]